MKIFVAGAGHELAPAAWLRDDDTATGRADTAAWPTRVITIYDGASPEEVRTASDAVRGAIRAETGGDDFLDMALLSTETADAVTEVMVAATTEDQRRRVFHKRAELGSDTAAQVLKDNFPHLWNLTGGFADMVTKPAVQLGDPVMFVYGKDEQGLTAHTDVKCLSAPTQLNQLVKTTYRGGFTTFFLVCEQQKTFVLLRAQGGCRPQCCRLVVLGMLVILSQISETQLMNQEQKIRTCSES